jgi:hypothetical protein
MLIADPGEQPQAKLNLRLNSGTETRWIRVDGEKGVEQIFENVNDIAERKVYLRVRELDIRKADIRDGDQVQIIGKGLGGAERMVRINLKLYEKEPERAAVPETSDQETIQSYIEAFYGINVPIEDIPFTGYHTFTVGESLAIGGRGDWTRESGDRSYKIFITER